MKTFPPPVRILVPGRVYRRDNLDLTHTPCFQQFEALVVGEGITMADPGTLLTLARELFGDVAIRPAKPSPTPSPARSGRDVSRLRRLGLQRLQGHRLARDPRQRHGPPRGVRGGGYDPEHVTGFAFGTGIERLAMLSYRGVDDIRLFYESDLRFLEQFPL